MIETFEDIREDATENGGGTYFLSRQRNRLFLGKSELRTGYYVATEDNEWSVDSIDANTIATFVSHHISELASDRDLYFGLWKAPSGRWYLDITEHFSAFDDAVMVGNARKQLAVWDIAQEEEITLSLGAVTF